jgi:hypothetical protein
MFSKSNPLPQWISDTETALLVDANDVALKLWRYERDNFIGRLATNLLCESEVQKSESQRRLNKWGESGPWKCRRGDGSECFMLVRWQQIDYQGRLCNFVIGIEVGETLDSMKPIAPQAQAASPIFKLK